jgi:hypothetical protein
MVGNREKTERVRTKLVFLAKRFGGVGPPLRDRKKRKIR